MNEGALRPVTVDGAGGLVPQPAAARRRRTAGDHLLPDVRVGARRARRRAARTGGGRRLALGQPDLRRLGPRAPAPLRGLRAGALGDGRRAPPRTAARRCRGRSTPPTSRSRRRRRTSRSIVERFELHRRLGRRRALPRRLRRPARPALPRRRGQAHQPLRAPALRAVRACSAASPGTCWRARSSIPEPCEQVVHGKQSREFAYGDVISFQQSGAGGYGDPLGARSRARPGRRARRLRVDRGGARRLRRRDRWAPATTCAWTRRATAALRAGHAGRAPRDRVHRRAGGVSPGRRPVRGRGGGPRRRPALDERAEFPREALQARRARWAISGCATPRRTAARTPTW